MRNPLNRWTLKSAIFLSALLVAPAVASAQANVAAQRGAEITPFVQTSLLTPDWGQTRNVGYTAGVDYTRLIQAIVQPSLELRYVSANGLNVSEHSFTGGFKLAMTYHRIHPYATLLAGTGGITFTHPQPGYPSDTSFIYSIGAGAEFNVTQSWKVRGDFLQQNWNLDPVKLTPVVLSVGVSYRIPFHTGGWVH
ncbi:MAG: outer membrane beta-barrel protein [Acidobacteriaceae bacterium]|jgi:opacity protein-like surface antigen